MFQKAQRKRAKLRLAIEGPSGSGKTYSALQIARGLVGASGKIAVLDTENESASLYAHLTDYDVAPLKAPYEPEAFIKIIKAAEQAGYDCLVIDSMSHEWSGPGGCLEIHGSMTGNSFINWGRVTPRHEKFMQAILNSPMHIISTMRSKETYAVKENDKGKQAPEKAGEAPQQRQGVSYEFTTVLTMNTKHVAESSKDRTGLFPTDYTFQPSTKTGEKLREWLESGVEVAPPALIDRDSYEQALSACTAHEQALDAFKALGIGKDHPDYEWAAKQGKARKDELLANKAAV